MKVFTGLKDVYGKSIYYGDILWGVNTVWMTVMIFNGSPFIRYTTITGLSQTIPLTNEFIKKARLSIKEI